MNVIPSAPVQTVKKELEVNNNDTINLYHENPHYELTLDEFEIYALKRVKVLRKLEQLKTMRVPDDTIKAKLDQLLKQEGLNERSMDEPSHFILRLAYCQSEELRRWFLHHESMLFQHRLKSVSNKRLAESVREYAALTPISKEEKERLRDPLQHNLSPAEFSGSSFYKVPFYQALELVAHRQCYVAGGYAYVPTTQVVTILMHKFRTHLSKALVILAQHHNYDNDASPEASRIYPLLKNLNRVLVHTEPENAHAVGGGGERLLTAQTVQGFKNRMPLCMRQLQTGLEQDKKLKHWGRLQYGLFLKGAGLSLEDALAYFQRMFSNITGEQFQKEYAYNIRHMYGKEGKRSNYTPYPCSKIIHGQAPSAGDHHGCPYKHYDADHLASLLQSMKIGSPQDRAAIISLKKSGQYQLACQKQFQVMHPDAAVMQKISLDNVGNHPNAWFRASVAYAEEQSGGGGGQTEEKSGGGTTVSP